jgi:hypothetical protein
MVQFPKENSIIKSDPLIFLNKYLLEMNNFLR